MGALLSLVPVKDWIYGGIIAALIAGGFWYHHKVYTAGIAHQVAVDNAQQIKIVQQAAAQTAELKAKATMAEQAYDKEIASLNSQPPVSVRLCNDAHHSGSGVPAAGAKVAGNAYPGAASGRVQQVPAGNTSSGATGTSPDIGGMLSALAASADKISATLREYQHRG